MRGKEQDYLESDRQTKKKKEDQTKKGKFRTGLQASKEEKGEPPGVKTAQFC